MSYFFKKDLLAMTINNRKVTIGILAHVDSGKTTLSEALLYETGAIRKQGRVDYGDTFLDTDFQERQRGITIFSKQAELVFKRESQAGEGEEAEPLRVTLLDTPGHVDFSAETERTLAVLDYAILIISGKDGVQAHTKTIWKMLKAYKIPVFIFINKTDLTGVDVSQVMENLKIELSGECVLFSDGNGFTKNESLFEEVATCEERLLEEYLEEGCVSDLSIGEAIAGRKLFPCFAGSALRLIGVDRIIDAAVRYIGAIEGEENGEELSAYVYKIARDSQDRRETHMKVKDGILRVRDSIGGEKVSEIRIYSGNKFETVEKASAGDIIAVTGLNESYAGQVIGKGDTERDSFVEPVLSYSVILPDGVSEHQGLECFKILQEEDPHLFVSWSEAKREIQIKIMGQVQLEILQNLIAERFGMDIRFGEGTIEYRETLSDKAVGAGHFEPLRHYAEAHVLMEPTDRGRGMKYGSKCSEDLLDKNWQRLIMTHLKEKEHVGPLTGSPITDVKISILAGRAHAKHTEGGDFRQATYRAVRQALRKAEAAGSMLLLEPWYEFELTVPTEMVGRAMADVQRMGGNFEAPETLGEMSQMKGRAPVSEMKDYITELASYTRGHGRMSCSLWGYDICHNSDDVIEKIGYDADRDVENTADSVFCSHGAGHNIPWDEADEMMHVTPNIGERQPDENFEHTKQEPSSGRLRSHSSGREMDAELERIFEKTYGSSKPDTNLKPYIEAREHVTEEGRKLKLKESEPLTEYLLVDGYNVIFAWDELKELAKVNIDAARDSLIDVLCNYGGMRNCRVIAVFDAYKVRGGERHIEKRDNITVVYTKEAETADTYIERTTYELAEENLPRRKNRVRVVTSDRLEQLIIMGNDAFRVSVRDFKEEVTAVNEEIKSMISEHSRRNRAENSGRIQWERLRNENEKND